MVLVLGFFQGQGYHDVEVIVHRAEHSAIAASWPFINYLGLGHGAKECSLFDLLTFGN